MLSMMRAYLYYPPTPLVIVLEEIGKLYVYLAFSKRQISKEQVRAVRQLMRQGDLHTVCEEARCPNLSNVFRKQLPL